MNVSGYLLKRGEFQAIQFQAIAQGLTNSFKSLDFQLFDKLLWNTNHSWNLKHSKWFQCNTLISLILHLQDLLDVFAFYDLHSSKGLFQQNWWEAALPLILLVSNNSSSLISILQVGISDRYFKYILLSGHHPVNCPWYTQQLPPNSNQEQLGPKVYCSVTT